MNKKYRRFLMYLLLPLTLILFICALGTRNYVYEGHSYYSKEKVALYLYKFEELPDNYINDYNKAHVVVNLENGNNIGGAHFRYEPDCDNENEYLFKPEHITYEDEMFECDVYSSRKNLIKANNRGVERLVYCFDNGKKFVYYTPNHYGQNLKKGEKPFYKMTPWSINLTSNVCYILTSILILGEISVVIYYIKFKKDEKEEFLLDVKEVSINLCSSLITIIILPFVLIYEMIKKIKNKDKIKRIEYKR